MAHPSERDPQERPARHVPAEARVRRVLLGAAGAALAFGCFLALAGMAAGPGGSPSPRAGGVVPDGLDLVVRTPPHLRSRADAGPLAARFAARGVERVWVQVKQDESDELPAGTASSTPRASLRWHPGFGDGRLGTSSGRSPAGASTRWHGCRCSTTPRRRRRIPEWRSQRIAEDGTLVTEDGWLCPFDPAVARHQAAIAAEVVPRAARPRRASTSTSSATTTTTPAPRPPPWPSWSGAPAGAPAPAGPWCRWTSAGRGRRRATCGRPGPPCGPRRSSRRST